MSTGPLIIQSDNTILLEVDHPDAHAARAAIAPFAELERAPEHIHTYRITPLALWNARAAGITADTVLEALNTYSRFPLPQPLAATITDTITRYGRLTLHHDPIHGLVLHSHDPAVLREILHTRSTAELLGPQLAEDAYLVPNAHRGWLKQELIKIGWPVDDQAGYVDGEKFPIHLDTTTHPWQLRDYQAAAAQSFLDGGSGVVVLPCGAGKTLVGAAAMAATGTTTLILVTTTVAGRQWRDELIARTTLRPEDIGEYSGERKEIRPVTIATYQTLTRKAKDGSLPALELFNARDWGLIIYDEVHLLPAPVFRLSADIQSRRRLGLTATLIREDGAEDDVFSLIGPKRYDVPWKDIEAQGWIAPAECIEVRTPLTDAERLELATATKREQFRIASCGIAKNRAIADIMNLHPGEPTLIIGAYIDQLHAIADTLDVPVIDGKTSNRKREELFNKFRAGELSVLVVSKVANFSIDLPSATVAIQVSGTFGSRQEEAQRLGRLMRPKANGATAHFYTVVSKDSPEATFALNRQRFLAEQGYAYRLLDASDLRPSVD